MFYQPAKTDKEIIYEIVDYNLGIIPDISDRAAKVLELVTRPASSEDNYSYILGRIEIDRVRLRGEDEIQVKEVVEDYEFPEGLFRVAIQQGQ